MTYQETLNKTRALEERNRAFSYELSELERGYPQLPAGSREASRQRQSFLRRETQSMGPLIFHLQEDVSKFEWDQRRAEEAARKHKEEARARGIEEEVARERAAYYRDSHPPFQREPEVTIPGELERQQGWDPDYNNPSNFPGAR